MVITLFAGLLGIGVWDGLRQMQRLLRNAARGAGNLAAGRQFTAGRQGGGLESLVDTLKVLGLLLGVIAGTAGLVVAVTGGSFGGAGAQVHW